MKLTECKSNGIVIPDLKYYAPEGEIIQIYKSSSKIIRNSKVIFQHFNFPMFISDEVEKKILPSSEYTNCFLQHIQDSEIDSDLKFCENLEFLRRFNKSPIILGGCGRSGTTLLLSILGAITNVIPVNESFSFFPSPYRMSILIDEIKQCGSINFQSQRWCEKTPKNVLAFDSIYKTFNKKVKLIHIVRDGRDVITSAHPLHPNQLWVSKERWIKDVSRGLELAKDIPICLIRYEDLISFPKLTLTSLCDFIEEEYTDNLLSYQNHTSFQESYNWKDNVATKLHNQSIKRWTSPEYSNIIEDFYSDEDAMTLLKKLNYL